jgi:hypothetical protein
MHKGAEVVTFAVEVRGCTGRIVRMYVVFLDGRFDEITGFLEICASTFGNSQGNDDAGCCYNNTDCHTQLPFYGFKSYSMARCLHQMYLRDLSQLDNRILSWLVTPVWSRQAIQGSPPLALNAFEVQRRTFSFHGTKNERKSRWVLYVLVVKSSLPLAISFVLRTSMSLR